MDAPQESNDWEVRLNNLIAAMVEANEIPLQVASDFKGRLVIMKLGLGRPGFVAILRDLMTNLGRLGCPNRKEYVQVTRNKFEQEIVLGQIVVDTILAKKSKSEGEEENG